MVSGYAYVGYLPNSASSEARVRRCFCRDGTVDSAYGFLTIVDVGSESVEEVALASNADDNNNRIYYAVIVSDHALRLWFSIATVGATWAEADPGFTDAAADLDMTWDHNWTCWHGRFLSYIDTAGRLHIVRHHGTTGWESLRRFLGPAPGNPPAISAFGDFVICTYRSSAGTIRCRISYDCGDAWELEDLTFSGHVQEPDVTARGGAGVAVVHQEFDAGGIDKVVLRRRSGYGPGSWDPAVQLNDHDVILGRDITLDWLPPMRGAKRIRSDVRGRRALPVLRPRR